jgi:hypothetical protein
VGAGGSASTDMGVLAYKRRRRVDGRNMGAIIRSP